MTQVVEGNLILLVPHNLSLMSAKNTGGQMIRSRVQRQVGKFCQYEGIRR